MYLSNWKEYICFIDIFWFSTDDALVENNFNKFECFFQVVDKRVSRNHGILELEDGKLYLTPVSKKSISEKIMNRPNWNLYIRFKLIVKKTSY